MAEPGAKEKMRPSPCSQVTREARKEGPPDSVMRAAVTEPVGRKGRREEGHAVRVVGSCHNVNPEG